MKNFILGYKYGFTVGTIFGIFPGAYLAFKTRRASMFFLSAIGSGAGFGFFASIGFILRSNAKQYN